MTSDDALRRSFDPAAEGAAKAAPTPEVPERIRRHHPHPQLRPDGSLRAMADAVDRAVIEREDARKAERVWAERLAARQQGIARRGRRMG